MNGDGNVDHDGDGAAAVRIEDVTVAFGENEVLGGLSTTIRPGRLVGLVGPNGAGKTTLLQTINGALSPDAGRVVVGEDPIASLSSKAGSRRVATVPQDTTISFDFDVREVVAMGRHPHRPRFGADPDPGAVDRAMERAGVDDMADRSVGTVSGGERQRVLIARALAQDAPVMLFDEPTASLDVNHQVGTLELIRELVGEGRTVVAAIHDLNLAARFCDEIVVLADGRILSEGPPAKVLTEGTLGDAFDANAVVTDHPVTGSPLVTALGDDEYVPPAHADDGEVAPSATSEQD